MASPEFKEINETIIHSCDGSHGVWICLNTRSDPAVLALTIKVGVVLVRDWIEIYVVW